MTSPTGRRTGLNPAIAAPYTGRVSSAAAPLIGMDFAQLEDRLMVFDYTPGLPTLQCTVWPRTGTYRLATANGLYTLRTASGNARQRRRQVREWRRQGFTVTHHWSKS